MSTESNGTPEAPQSTGAAPAPAAAASGAVVAPPVTPKPIAPAAAVAAVPAVPLPNALAHLPTPFQAVDYVLKGYHLDARVTADQVVSAAQQLDREGFALDTITGVDWLAEGQMEVVYDYFHPLKFLRAVVRTRVPRDNPEVQTISKVYPGANWHERETHDFFGIHFLGHPNLLPFLLPEDATYHPLRKDFTT
jgi:NADH-quinone oxidoreductase subunit C